MICSLLAFQNTLLSNIPGNGGVFMAMQNGSVQMHKKKSESYPVKDIRSHTKSELF
jgi:hypothetical protein